MFESLFTENRTIITFIVYISFLLDNVLLTVIVPILPDLLSQNSIPDSVAYKNFTLHYVSNVIAGKSSQIAKNFSHVEKHISDENSSIGIILATKAIVQLVFNPIVGGLTAKVGYRIPLIVGTCHLLVATIIFAVGDSSLHLLIARGIQGIGSACLGVCGMSLIAYLYPEDEKRSRIMGYILGSVAVGVLVGYPFGGFLYDFIGKSAPFYVIIVFLLLDLTLQIYFMEFNQQTESGLGGESCHWWPLLSDKLICLISAAIWISTSAMAILEPCLPLWLMENLHPKKWQLGTVFIPDSVGYFIGTNFLSTFAYRAGQIRVAVFSLIVVGICCTIIPATSSIMGLLVPHFGLGLGIGTIDAALVPLLASAVDSKSSLGDSDSITSNSISHYGAVYAIQQIAVSLAYSIAPLLGGELAGSIGFPWLMRIIGIACIIYAPMLLYHTVKVPITKDGNKCLLKSMPEDNEQNYKRFYDTID